MRDEFALSSVPQKAMLGERYDRQKRQGCDDSRDRPSEPAQVAELFGSRDPCLRFVELLPGQRHTDACLLGVVAREKVLVFVETGHAIHSFGEPNRAELSSLVTAAS